METMYYEIITLATLVFLFIKSSNGIENITETECRPIQDCACNKTNTVFEYQCKGFKVVFENDLNIICVNNEFENSVNISFVEFKTWNFDRMGITSCAILANSTLPLVFGSHLSELQIKFAEINLTPDLFVNRPRLQKLNLASNFIKEISPNVFENQTRLTHLDLSNNSINALPNSVFFALRKLKYLNLKKNKLTEINSLLFYNLQNLEEINLSHNGLKGLHIEAFQRLINLKVINLSYNFLQYDSFFAFYNNINLVKTDFSHNRISNMENDWIHNKIFLNDLNLSFNEISSVQMFDMLAVAPGATINLQHNKITSIHLPNKIILQELDIQNNKNYAMRININNNPIICDCNLYDFVKFLNSDSTNVQFETGQVQCASPQTLSGFPLDKLTLDLLYCDFENNCPEACNCKYRRWDEKVIVDCAKKNLSVTPDLNSITTLSPQKLEVNLEGNFLTNGPSEEMGYYNVTKLMMSNNIISSITWIPPKLEVLELGYNSIKTLNYEVLLELSSPKLTNLNLGNNPWICDCSTVPLSTFLITELTSKQIDINKIQCSDDQRLLIYINSENLCRLSNSYISIITGIICLIILGLSTGVITRMVCNHRKNMRPNLSRLV